MPTHLAAAAAELAHADARAQLGEALDTSLDAQRRQRLHEHLDRCPPCRAFARTLRATTALARSLPKERAPASAKERLLRLTEGP